MSKGVFISGFRCNQRTCAGDEIGWEFVNKIMKTKCSFHAFCELKKDDYVGGCRQLKFMSAPTFRYWFRCWASHQDREFREQCQGCGDNISVLGCDGTAIGK